MCPPLNSLTWVLANNFFGYDTRSTSDRREVQQVWPHWATASRCFQRGAWRIRQWSRSTSILSHECGEQRRFIGPRLPVCLWGLASSSCAPWPQLPARETRPSWGHQTYPRHTQSHPFPIYPQYWKKQNIVTYFIPFPSFLCLNICDMFFQTWKHKIIFLAENKHSLVQCTQGNAFWTLLHPWNEKFVKANSKIGLQKETPRTINNCPDGFTKQRMSSATSIPQ